jgi:drug/metabolite transporter (DMT)-like permease
VDAAAIALVLAAAGLHASWNLRLHEVEDRVGVLAASGLVIGAALAVFVARQPPLEVWPSVVVSGVAETVYGLALAGAYARGDLAATYPVGRGTAPLLVTVGGWALLSQAPSGAAIAGAACLAAGLIALALRSRRARMLRASGLALVVGLAIATYSLADARAIAAGASPLAYLGTTMCLQGVLTLAVLRVDLARVRRALRAGAQVAVGSAGAYALILVAFSLAPAGRVATLREVSVLIALVAARRRSGERTGRLGWVGAGLVVAGAVLAAR